MLSLVTRQNLLAEKTRFAISVGGIALSVFLISFLLSLYQGWKLNVGRFVERVEADVWVAREGTSDFIAAASILPNDMQGELEALDGVRRVDPVVVRPMRFEETNANASTHLVGYDTESGVGGPVRWTKGKEVPGPGEAIIDATYGRVAGVSMGDTLRFGGRELEVAGVSTGGDFVFSQTTFVTLDEARSLLGMADLTTFYLVQLEDGADVDAFTSSVEDAFPGVVALTSDEFADTTRNRVMASVVPILIVILFLAFVVGVAITGLTIYNATVEKAREFGILKAIGFTNGYLYRLVLEQSLVTGLLGFAIGVGLTVLGSRFASDFVPQFVTLVRWQDLTLVLGATLLMSVIAALLPVRRIAGVDPVMVFNT